jgi:ABC-type polysaccharide/polyol phosphate transport system ATPase subunit
MLLWLLAVILAVVGVVQLLQGQIILAIVLFIAACLAGLTRQEVRERVDQIAAFSGLDTATLQSPLRTYSAGMGLRLGFAVTVHTDPAVLVVDEVLAVGDTAFQERCMHRIGELRADGTAAVVVSHDLDLVSELCGHVLVLDRGEVVHDAPASSAVPWYRARYGELPAAPDRTPVFGRTSQAKARRARRAL